MQHFEKEAHFPKLGLAILAFLPSNEKHLIKIGGIPCKLQYLRQDRQTAKTTN